MPATFLRSEKRSSLRAEGAAVRRRPPGHMVRGGDSDGPQSPAGTPGRQAASLCRLQHSVNRRSADLGRPGGQGVRRANSQGERLPRPVLAWLTNGRPEALLLGGYRRLMMLVLRPNDNGSPDDHHVMQGGWQVGRIYKRRDALRPESQWLWFISGMSRCPPAVPITGTTATQEDALAATQDAWNKLLAWAQLAPFDRHQARPDGPRVVSVSISSSKKADQID